MTSFYLDYLARGSVSKYSHILGDQELGLQHVDLGDHNLAHNRGKKAICCNFSYDISLISLITSLCIITEHLL